MKKEIKNSFRVEGIVTKRLYDREGYNKLIEAIQRGDSRDTIEKLEREASKKIFTGNGLWKFLNNMFNLDLQIPVLLGSWELESISKNLITTRGKQVVVDLIGGIETDPVTAIALGTGTTAAAAGDTALESEITTNGGSRGAATISHETTTTTYDTYQAQKTFTFTGSLAITEEGLFDDNTSGGNMLARQVFSAVNVSNTDVLQVTHQVATSVS